MKWISVKDEMPKPHSGLCLMFCKIDSGAERVSIGYYQDTYSQWVNNAPIIGNINKVTHWMPLPNEP